MTKDLLYTAIIVLLGGFIFFKGCKNKAVVTPDPIIEVRIDTVYDTSTVSVPTYIPKYRVILDTVVDVDTIPVDTLSILKDYFAKLEYTDTIKLDSIGYVAITDLISKNKIQSRDVNYSYRLPIVTKEVTITKQQPLKSQVYFGINPEFNKEDLVQSMGVVMLIKNKRDQMYGFNAGFTNSMTPYIGGMLLWKIKLK